MNPAPSVGKFAAGRGFVKPRPHGGVTAGWFPAAGHEQICKFSDVHLGDISFLTGINPFKLKAVIAQEVADLCAPNLGVWQIGPARGF